MLLEYLLELLEYLLELLELHEYFLELLKLSPITHLIYPILIEYLLKVFRYLQYS